tara:strand:- start:5 stop:688 length:684 start_codon:yes stop_codon:yes gene_type:complete
MKKWKVAAFLLLGAGLINLFEPVQYLTFENLKLYRVEMVAFYQANIFAMIGGYIAVYILIGLFLLPGATFLSIAAGVIFGPEMGVGVVVIGSTFGAALAFLISRHLLRDWVEKKFSKKVKAININLCDKPLNSVLFFQLIPLFPFFAVNIGFALSQIFLRHFFFGTMLGKLPATYVYAHAGSNLSAINSIEEVMSMKVLGSLFLLGLLAIVPVIYKNVKVSAKSKNY